MQREAERLLGKPYIVWLWVGIVQARNIIPTEIDHLQVADMFLAHEF